MSKRNAALPGYPSPVRFATKDDVLSYLAGDRVVCLMCGRSMRMIAGNHLRAHGMTDDQYRERFGIPYSYALVSKESVARYRENTERRLKAGWRPPIMGQALREAMTGQRRPSPQPKNSAQHIEKKRERGRRGQAVRQLEEFCAGEPARRGA